MKSSHAVFFVAAAAAILTIASAAEIKIEKAVYGAGKKIVDVTPNLKLQAVHVPGKFFAVPVGNQLVASDPASGEYKILSVTYSIGDQKPQTISVGEQHFLIIVPELKPTAEFKIQHACYGGENQWMDVTEKIRTAHAKGEKFRVNNQTFQKDPLPGKGKQLVILFSKDGKFSVVTCRETTDFSPAVFEAKKK
ncbi:MAG: hypothetical protein PHS41_06985 [Victivallaceae bacterium]|nr:hypothetical protein [Victivallaceae bacterium]